MLFPRSLILFPLLLSSTGCTVLTSGCNQGTERADIDNAINDVVTVASAVVSALQSGKINGKEDVFESAYEPLFLPGDQLWLSLVFGQLSLIKTNQLFVMIYCTENHIVRHRNDPTSYWEDSDYVSRPNGRQMPIPVDYGTNKPGAKGSYTTLGFKHDDQWDTSGMVHIYIAESRRHPPANTDRDLRRYPDIVKDGLDGSHNFIENIKPLAQTVMHELLHAVGGLTEPDPTNKNKRSQVINDGPSKNTYGWLSCNIRRDFGQSNIKIADCLTYLAQAIFLQIEGKDTYWTTGEVDPETLRPRYLTG